MNSKQRNRVKKNVRHSQIKKALLTTGITTLSVSGALLTSSLRTHAAEVPNELTTNQVNSMESSHSDENEVALHTHDTQPSVSKAEESETTKNVSNNSVENAETTDTAETDSNTTQPGSETNTSEPATSETNEQASSNIVDENSSKSETTPVANSDSSSSAAVDTAKEKTSQDSEENNVQNDKQNDQTVPNQPRIASLTKTISTDQFNIGDKRYTTADAVDISSWQSWMTQADFNYLKQIGIRTIIVKTTEGHNYTNPYAQNQITMAKNAGLNVSIYHFVRFNDTNSARTEANYAASVMNNFKLPYSTLIFADIEADETRQDNLNMNSALKMFWSVLNQHGYTNHGVYVGPYYEYLNQVVATVGKNRTWLAQYPYTPTKSGYYEQQWQTAGYGGWQFSSQAKLRGNSLDVSHSFNSLLTSPNNSTIITNGQLSQNGHWYLYKGGRLQTGLQYISDQHKTVLYNSYGQMVYGENKVNGHWYLFDSVTGAMKTGFQHISQENKTAFYDANGQMVYGERKINGHWYLFDSVTGAMKTGFQHIKQGNKTAFYDANGQMVYGERKINGHWYLFDSVTGAMKTGFQHINQGNKTAFYDANGQMVYGERKINGHWYLFDSVTGAMKTGFQHIKQGNKTVFYDANGQMVHGESKINGHWYLFDSVTGAMKTGFQHINQGNKTAFYNTNGQMLYGYQKINGKIYYFDTITGALKN
ncbi:GH25 family lysozyme [Ligilactobacillus acidipiscis]|uniref:GH25 family lysozyme n=2 Tax=Ligilactobacillus acidipiscis TaxID=89059 RepID=UPI0022E5263A|nr:GH25 family lysozyme [Ligilactobacillus acidipiscis]